MSGTRRAAARLAIAAGVVLVAGCRERSLTQPVPGAPTVMRVVVGPAPDTIAVGGSVQLTATVYDSAGAVLTGRVVDWTVADTSVATVSASGLVSGAAFGVDSVIATVEGRQGGARVAVFPAGPAADIGGLWDWTEQLAGPPGAAVCTDTGTFSLVQNGAVVSGPSQHVGVCGGPAGVSSNDHSDSVRIGAVGATSVWFTIGYYPCGYTATLLGTRPDTMRGTAVCGSLRGTWQAVRNLPVATVAIRGDTAALFRGATQELFADLFSSSGQQLFGRQVNWTTADPSVATVTPNPFLPLAARARGVAVGTTTLTAAVAGLQAAATLTVQAVPFAAVAVGGAGSCALDATGAAYCWGDKGGLAPAAVSEGTIFFDLAVGSRTFCGLTPHGASYCSGGGLSDTATTRLPFFAITAAGGTQQCGANGCHYFEHACGITVAGAYCWGSNESGELGNGDLDDQAGPVPVAGPPVFVVSAGAFHTCGLTAAAAAYCWGLNTSGQLGNDSVGRASAVPRPVAGGHTFWGISAADDHTCALTPDGAAWCWGGSGIGNATPSDSSSVPVPVSGGLLFVALTTGPGFSCGLDAGGQVYCWGRASWIPSGASPVPTAVLSGYSFSSIAAGSGDSHLCGLDLNLVAYCVGNNDHGQLGDGTTTSSSVPVLVTGQLQGAPVARPIRARSPLRVQAQPVKPRRGPRPPGANGR